jgi:hypothetical protein
LQLLRASDEQRDQVGVLDVLGHLTINRCGVAPDGIRRPAARLDARLKIVEVRVDPGHHVP